MIENIVKVNAGSFITSVEKKKLQRSAQILSQEHKAFSTTLNNISSMFFSPIILQIDEVPY